MCSHTFSRVWWICDNHIVLPGNPEDLAVSDGVDVSKLSQFLEIWAHQYFHLAHVRLLDLEDTNPNGVNHIQIQYYFNSQFAQDITVLDQFC